jgi:hypothetical protein
MLDQRRVEIQRHRLTLEQRIHARKQQVERPLDLPDAPEVETRQETAERRRIRHRIPRGVQKLGWCGLTPRQRGSVGAPVCGDRLCSCRSRSCSLAASSS